MKKLVIILFLAIISFQKTYAINTSKYFDQGVIYTNSGFPVDVAKTTDDNIDLKKLKCGESTSNNILGIIETGDGGIQSATRNGGIKKIYYVDKKVDKVYIPLIFIPIYVKQTKTIVYGE